MIYYSSQSMTPRGLVSQQAFDTDTRTASTSGHGRNRHTHAADSPACCIYNISPSTTPEIGFSVTR